MNPPAPTRNEAAPAGRTRILVVDDELGMRLSCHKVLTAEGYEVEMAPDGQAGYELFSARRDFAAALIDMKMPRMGGIELIEKIRAVDEDIVLLVITAYATIDTAVEATKRGAYSYIPKPFTPDELLLPVRNGLDRRALSLEAKQLRREREKQLLEISHERSRSMTILTCMTDGVLVVNRDRQIVLDTPAMARLLGAAAPAASSAPLDGLPSAELRGLIEEVLAPRGGPGLVSREFPIGERQCLASASPVLDPGGETLGAVAVVRDITELRRLEVAKSIFVSMVAHEIKNPLAAIEGFLNLVVSGAAGNDPKRDHEMLARALVRARTLRQMVAELTSLRAMETGNFALTRAPVDLGEALAECVAQARDKAKGRGIEVAFASPAATGLAIVLADRHAITEIFSNLLDNAIKYTPERGHVAVECAPDAGSVAVRVRDDGIGIAAEDMPRIFDEFFRSRNELTARVPGKGLGLSIVKRLVELHGGTIGVRTEPGRGSEFTVSLPILNG